MLVGFICMCVGSLFGGVLTTLVAWVGVATYNTQQSDGRSLLVIPAAAVFGTLAGPILLMMFFRVLSWMV